MLSIEVPQIYLMLRMWDFEFKNSLEVVKTRLLRGKLDDGALPPLFMGLTAHENYSFQGNNNR